MPVIRLVAAHRAGATMIALVLATQAACGGTIALTPIADGNFTNGILNVKPPAQFGLVVNGLDHTLAVVEYDLHSIPDALIDRVDLRFWQTFHSGTSGQVGVYGY